MKLVLLGTAGGPTPKRRRAAPSQAIVLGDRTIIVDCGNGVARQLVLAGIAPTSLERIVVTHHHSDHVADLVTLPLLAWASGLDREVVLHGPPPLRDAVEAGLRACDFDVRTRCADEARRPLRELLRPLEHVRDGVIHEDEQLVITAARVEHPPIAEAFAYRFDSPGGSIVISGDTAPCDALVRLARGADVLVHEVLLADEAEVASWLRLPEEHALVRHVVTSHTHYSALGRIARDAGVRKLVLSHFVPGDAEIDRDRVVATIARDFAGEIVLGEDLMEVSVATAERP